MLASAVPLSRLIVTPEDFGATGNGIDDDTTPILNAIAAAITLNVKLVFRNIYRTTSTITFAANFLKVEFWGNAQIRPDSSVLEGVVIGSTSLPRGMIIRELHVNRTAFSTATENIGIKFLECNQCVFENLISRQSKYNFKFTPSTAGFVYNDFINLIGNQGFVNLWIEPSGTGWVNENVFLGGRMVDGGNSETHVILNRIDSAGCNNNRFYAMSTETAFTMDQAWLIKKAESNLIDQPRTEGTFNNGDIVLKTDAQKNKLTSLRSDTTIVDESIHDTNTYELLAFGQKFVTTPNQVLNTRLVRQGANSTTPTNGIPITGATQADPVVIASNGHGLSNGDDIFIRNVGGMEEINFRVFETANVTANTYELLGIDGSSYTAYTSGGYAMPGVPHTTIEDVYSASGNSQALDIYFGRTGTSSYAWRIIADSNGSVKSSLTNDGDLRIANSFRSDIATGTAPLIVASTTLVTNLNANFLSGNAESAFVRLLGRSGGQNLIGGTGSGDDLILTSTSNATKGTIIVEDALIVQDTLNLQERVDSALTYTTSGIVGDDRLYEINATVSADTDASARSPRALYAELITNGATNFGSTSKIIALQGQVKLSVNITTNAAVGLQGRAWAREDNTCTTMTGLEGRIQTDGGKTQTSTDVVCFDGLRSNTGTIAATNFYFFRADVAIAGTFTVTNQYGFFAPNLTDGTNNYGLYSLTRCFIKQSSTTAAVPVLILDQADISEEMIEFNTTIGVGNAIEAVGAKTLTTTHFIKVTLPGGLTRYIPCGTIA